VAHASLTKHLVGGMFRELPCKAAANRGLQENFVVADAGTITRRANG